MTHARRVDGNQALIVEALRRSGYYVLLLSGLGDGVFDLLVVGHYKNAMLMECKAEHGRLTPAQLKLWDEYPGPKTVVRCAEDAVIDMILFDEWIQEAQ